MEWALIKNHIFIIYYININIYQLFNKTIHIIYIIKKIPE